jgi:hypothetical protein
MMLWEAVPEGDFECYVDPYYGVVGLRRPWNGWRACLVGPDTEEVAPRLYTTAREAQGWVEARVAQLVRD